MTSITSKQAEIIDSLLDILVENQNLGILAQRLILKLMCSKGELIFLIDKLKLDIRHENNIVIEFEYIQRTQSAGRIIYKENDFDDLMLYKNYNTQKFIDAGGCSNWFSDKIKEFERGVEERENQKKRDELEITKLLKEIEEFKFKQRNYRVTLAIAIITVAIAIITVAINLSGLAWSIISSFIKAPN